MGEPIAWIVAALSALGNIGQGVWSFWKKEAKSAQDATAKSYKRLFEEQKPELLLAQEGFRRSQDEIATLRVEVARYEERTAHQQAELTMLRAEMQEMQVELTALRAELAELRGRRPAGGSS